MKTAEQGADVLASEGIAEAIIADGYGTGSAGQSKDQIQSAGDGVEDALEKLHVRATPQE
jgi:hypothetical protein